MSASAQASLSFMFFPFSGDFYIPVFNSFNDNFVIANLQDTFPGFGQIVQEFAHFVLNTSLALEVSRCISAKHQKRHQEKYTPELRFSKT